MALLNKTLEHKLTPSYIANQVFNHCNLLDSASFKPTVVEDSRRNPKYLSFPEDSMKRLVDIAQGIEVVRDLSPDDAKTLLTGTVIAAGKLMSRGDPDRFQEYLLGVQEAISSFDRKKANATKVTSYLIGGGRNKVSDYNRKSPLGITQGNSDVKNSYTYLEEESDGGLPCDELVNAGSPFNLPELQLLSVEEENESKLDRLEINEGVKSLDPKHASVIIDRFGLDGSPAKSLKTIAISHGWKSPSHTSYYIKKSIEQLSDILPEPVNHGIYHGSYIR